MKDVLVANQHTGGLVFPRRSQGGVALPSIRVAPGCVAKIPGDVWENFKNNPVVVAWIANGHLRVVNRESARVDVQSSSTVDTEALVEVVAPHLADAAEEQPEQQPGGHAKKGGAAAGVRRKKAGEVTIS